MKTKMSEKDRVEGRKFLEKHFNAHIGRGRLRLQTMYPMDYWLRVAYRPIDPAQEYHYQVEESVDVSMRESDFERLLDILGYFQTHNQHDRYFVDLERKLAFERQLREKHPGVKKAYERYRILLDLVSEGRDIEE